MTRKDFVLIADTLKAAKPLYIPEDREVMFAYSAWENVAYGMATALARTNPAFDRTRFLTACGVV